MDEGLEQKLLFMFWTIVSNSTHLELNPNEHFSGFCVRRSSMMQESRTTMCMAMIVAMLVLAMICVSHVDSSKHYGDQILTVSNSHNLEQLVLIHFV